MKNQITWIGCLVALAGLSTSCGEKPKVLVPYQVGTTWTYEVVQSDSAGKPVKESTDTSKVTGDMTLEGVRWFCVEEFGQEFWVRVGPKGAEEALVVPNPSPESKGFLVERKWLFFKYPATKGETYPVGDPALKEEVQVIETDFEVQVPAGTFRCVVYEVHGPEGVISRIALAPGTGVVRFDFPNGYAGSPLVESRQLVKFEAP